MLFVTELIAENDLARRFNNYKPDSRLQPDWKMRAEGEP